MFESISQHLTVIILAALALLVGITITIKVVRKSKKDSNEVTRGRKLNVHAIGRY